MPTFIKNGTKLTIHKSIPNRSRKICLRLVKHNGLNIQFIEDTPNEEIQLAAVTQNGLSIKFIKDPSDKVVMAAYEQNEFCIKFITKERLEVIEFSNLLKMIKSKTWTSDEKKVIIKSLF